MRQTIIILFFGLLLSSCCTTRQCKIERAETKIFNLTQKFPELLEANDTIVINDTITTTTINTDTTFVDNNTTDTIVITNDKITIKYVKKDSLIFIQGECEGDTIYVTNEIPIEKIVVRSPTFAERAKDWTYLLFAIAAVLLVMRIFFKDFFRIFK